MLASIRNYYMEFMGTFFLIFTILLTGNAIAIGLMLMAMIYIGSHVSGAHFNPAVTVAHWMRGRFMFGSALWYFVAQILGGALAAGLVYALSGQVIGLIEMPTNANMLVPAAFEALFAFVFCLVILTITSTGFFRDIRFHGLVIGLTLTSIAFIQGLVINPAVALGSVLIGLASGAKMNAVTNALLVHVIPPIIGGIAAAYKFGYLNPDER